MNANADADANADVEMPMPRFPNGHIQPVFNGHNAIADMCVFMSRSEDNCSNAMKQALKTSTECKCRNYEQMRAVAHVYYSNRERSVQEAVYRCFYLIYVNTNILEKHFRVLRSQKELSKLLDDSDNIFNPFMHNVVKWPNILLKSCGVCILQHYA